MENICRMLHESGAVHVRGTPATGKTTLAQLIAVWLTTRHFTVLYMDDWQVDANARTLLVKRCHEAGYKRVQEWNFLSPVNDNLVFIIDEAQATYENSHLWYAIIKSRIGQSMGPRFCLFSSYGSPTTGSPQYPPRITPPILSYRHRVSLTSSANENKYKVSLFYNRSEFEDAVTRFCQLSTVEYALDRELRDYLFSLTSGHPGMVRSTLEFITKVCVQKPTFPRIL